MDIERKYKLYHDERDESIAIPADQRLRNKLKRLTRAYVAQMERLSKSNLAGIEKAQDEFEAWYKFEINSHFGKNNSFEEEECFEEKANIIREAAAGIALELFDWINPPPEPVVQEKPNKLLGLFRKKQPKPLGEWQIGNLKLAADRAINYAAAEYKKNTERSVSPDLLASLRRGIFGFDEKARENFKDHIILFVDAPQLNPNDTL